MNRTPEQIQQSLFALTTRGIKYDLERISAAAAAIGNPQERCPSFHVAGTNGKGSTCVFIESVLRNAGYTTGLFTSPHLVKFEERFRINGVMVDTGEWVEVFHDLETIIADHRLTFFEATMLMAVELFKRRGVEWAVYETGLGGRLDATNILHPRVSVITRVAMDHREYLGTTIEEVFAEKLGIVKTGIPLVIADPGEPELHRMVETVCAEQQASCTFVTVDTRPFLLQVIPGGIRFVYDGTTFFTRLIGNYQVENALLAITAIEASTIGIERDVVQKGIAKAFIPGRFERRTVGEKTVVLDVAHNPSAAIELCALLRTTFPGTPVCFVAGIMADKEYPAMLDSYASAAAYIILTRPVTDRAASPEKLAAHLQEGNFAIVERVAEAFRQALDREEPVVCVTGSFYTVGEAIALLPVVQPE